ncbi:hypothetical protein FRC19_001617 [Serendipita sp. 401]|nr:hypothetical protein FRC19_001617 [Serendipita sp. 401]
MSDWDVHQWPEKNSFGENQKEDTIGSSGFDVPAPRSMQETMPVGSQLTSLETPQPSQSGTSARRNDEPSLSSSSLFAKPKTYGAGNQSSSYSRSETADPEEPSLLPISEFFASAPGCPSIFILKNSPTSRPTQEVVRASSLSTSEIVDSETITDIQDIEIPGTPSTQNAGELEDIERRSSSDEEDPWFAPTTQCPLPFRLYPDTRMESSQSTTGDPFNFLSRASSVVPETVASYISEDSIQSQYCDPQASVTTHAPPSPSVIPDSEESDLEDFSRFDGMFVDPIQSQRTDSQASVTTESLDSTEHVLPSPSVIPDSEESDLEDFSRLDQMCVDPPQSFQERHDLSNDTGRVTRDVSADLDDSENMVMD